MGDPTELPATPENVLTLRAQRLSLREIAARLRMSPKTVNQIVKRQPVSALRTVIAQWAR